MIAPLPDGAAFDAALVEHGRGHADIARRLTWRQIERFWEMSEARRREALEAQTAPMGVRLGG